MKLLYSAVHLDDKVKANSEIILDGNCFYFVDMIAYEGIDPLKTTEDIVKFIYEDNLKEELTLEEQKYIAVIYDHLKTYRKECFCINCIRSWLVSLIIEHKDEDVLQKHITEMLEGNTVS